VARLARELAASLARKRLRARTVTLKLRYDDFTTITRSHTAESFTNAAPELVNRAQTLLERTEAETRPVRLLGVGLTARAREDAPTPLWGEASDESEADSSEADPTER